MDLHLRAARFLNTGVTAIKMLMLQHFMIGSWFRRYRRRPLNRLS